jgi:hypothetical protein
LDEQQEKTMEAGQWIVIILSGAMLVWFLAARRYNQARGVTAMGWCRKGMRQFGDLDISKHPAGVAAGGRASVSHPSHPFKTLEVFYALEGRENLPLWLLQRWQGRRDLLVIRARLNTAPQGDVQAASHRDKDFRILLAQEQKMPYRMVPGPGGFEIAERGHLSENALACLRVFLAKYPNAVLKVSLQRGDSHLLVRSAMTPLLTYNPEVFFTDLAVLGGSV